MWVNIITYLSAAAAAAVALLFGAASFPLWLSCSHLTWVAGPYLTHTHTKGKEMAKVKQQSTSHTLCSVLICGNEKKKMKWGCFFTPPIFVFIFSISNFRWRMIAIYYLTYLEVFSKQCNLILKYTTSRTTAQSSLWSSKQELGRLWRTFENLPPKAIIT